MKNDDLVIPQIPEVKTVSSSPEDQANNTTSEGRLSSSESSSSSPSDLKRRLQDLPSPNEFVLLADRVATLGRRISRKRELFLRLHGVANRIEENDEWEERERAGSEGIQGAFKPKDARARRRARIRLESSLNGDKVMVISQTGDPTGPTSQASTDSDDKTDPNESIVDRSTRDRTYLQSSTLELASRRQSRAISVSEPASTRPAPRHNNVAWHDSNKSSGSNFHTYRNFTPRDSASRLDLPSAAPFSLSNVQPKKFGGYRPSSGIILKNFSSGSESESANETNCGQSCAHKTGSTIATLELSSPESKTNPGVQDPIKKMPIMSARIDITRSILPSLLSSERSLRDDDDVVVGQAEVRKEDASPTANYIPEQLNRNESSTRFPSPQVENATANARSTKNFYNKAADDRLSMNVTNEPWHVTAKYDECEEKEKILQNTVNFATRSFLSEELAASAYSEQMNRDLLNDCSDKFQAPFENERNDEQMQLDSCCLQRYNVVPSVHHDLERCGFNCSTVQASRVEMVFSRNNDKPETDQVFDVANWDRLSNFYTNETYVDTPGLIDRARTAVTEDAPSSEISEAFASEDHSRSSYAAKMCLQNDVSSNRKSRNDMDMSDKYDLEIVTNDDVPTLALNSQDVSYSTSAGSRECPAMRPLDPHALIQALSDVSLKQERQEDAASRKHEDPYRLDNDTTSVVSSQLADFPAKGETWRATRFSSSPRKSLTRIPSRIPVRISTSKNTLFGNNNKLSGSFKNSNRGIASDENAQFVDRSDAVKDILQGSVAIMNSPYEACEQYSSREDNIELMVKTHPTRFSLDDGVRMEAYEAAKDDYEGPGGLIPSRLQDSLNSFDNETYQKMDKQLSNTGQFNDNCLPGFFNEQVIPATYSSNRDYAKIDDDVRSSTSRKTMETVDITSATGSPYLPAYKHDSAGEPRNESSRNMEENATWRTEDECASINNEDPEDLEEGAKDENYYATYGNKMEEMYARINKHEESAIEEIYDWSPPKTQRSQINLSLEIERIARKQSRTNFDSNFADDQPDSCNRDMELARKAEDPTSQVCRTQEVFVAKMSSSTVNSGCESKRKRKSQERFPFTISESSRALSASKRADTSDLADKHANPTDTKDTLPRDKSSMHQLKPHPSITRLASSGLEDTMAEILCCVVQEQRENKSSSRSKMRAFVRLFSSKLRRISKQRNYSRSAEPAKIIYENRACQADSKTDSCSSADSSAEKAHRLNLMGNIPWTDHSSNSILVSDANSLKKTESLEAISPEYPRRKYDRDNLWVQDIKDSLLDEDTDDKVIEGKTAVDDSAPNPEHQYSIFLAKDLESDKLAKSSEKFWSSRKGNDVPTSGHLISVDDRDKRDVAQQEVSLNFISEVELEEDLTGCQCLRLCLRLFVPSRHRSSIREQTSSSLTMKRSNSLSRERKK